MKIKIDATGGLWIKRAADYKKVWCPITQTKDQCGDWCPLFGEPDPEEDADGNVTRYSGIDLCHRARIVGEIIDERVKE